MTKRQVAEECSEGSEAGKLTFPQVLGKLAVAGIEGYLCDLRSARKTYYLPEGEAIDVAARRYEVPVADAFDAGAVEAAVRLSQANAHSYDEFCEKVMRAGCSFYLVSLPGRRVVYFGRTGESHIEHFPS